MIRMPMWYDPENNTVQCRREKILPTYTIFLPFSFGVLVPDLIQTNTVLRWLIIDVARYVYETCRQYEQLRCVDLGVSNPFVACWYDPATHFIQCSEIGNAPPYAVWLGVISYLMTIRDLSFHAQLMELTYRAFLAWKNYLKNSEHDADEEW